MARAKYTIANGDLQFAVKYLISACDDQDYFIRGAMTSHKFLRFIEKLVDSDDAEFDARRLNIQCEKYLVTAQWSKMKTSIRKMRYLEQNKDITISIKPEAHQALQDVVGSGHANNLSQAILWLAGKK